MNRNFETWLCSSCSSTMDEAKKYILEQNQDVNHVVCFVTRNQTNGRGRGGSVWEQAQLTSPKIMENSEKQFFPNLALAIKNEQDFLPLTLVIPAQKLKLPMEWLTIAVGCALYDALKKLENFLNNTFYPLSFRQEENKIFLKWPNDLITLPDGKKIAGILCESSVLNKKLSEIYIGIGLNLMSSPSLEKSTSYILPQFILSQKKEVRGVILEHFANYFCEEFEEYLLHERSVSQLKSLAMERFIPKGTMLSVNKGALRGKFLDIASNAALLLEGIKEPIYSGDVVFEENKVIEKPILKNVEKKIEIKNKCKPILAIDFGNTRIHLSFRSSKNSVKYVDLNYEKDFESSQNLKLALKFILEIMADNRSELLSLYYTSVNKIEITQEFLKKIKDFFKSIFPEIKFNLVKITEKDVFENSNVLGNFCQQRLGADRALKFYFAYQEAVKKKKNTLIFSLGTAFTCEGVSKDGFILENFVSPGLQMSFNALHDYTALLPSLLVNPDLFNPEGRQWGQEIYMQRGVFLSVVGSILATSKMHAPCTCYLSGGNAEHVQHLINQIAQNTNDKIELSIISNIETNVIFQIADSMPLSFQSYGEVERSEKVTTLLATMLKSRISEKDRRNIPIRLEAFTRIGGRIENSEEDRFDLYMAKKFKFYNREQWRERILNSEVMIEHGAPREKNLFKKPFLNRQKPTYKIKNFDQIWLFRPPEYEPEFLDTIHVVYENKDVCVFSKPPNLVVHAAGLYLKNTFVEHISKMGFENCSPVHRIDRETSGILTCARKPETRKFLSEAFRSNQVKKMYLAVTKGSRPLPIKFRVELPIGEPENSAIRLKLWVNGRNTQPALTHFMKLATFDDYSLVACSPITGRTNQIRIHLAALGQWIVGDKMYHNNESVFIEFFEKGFTQWVQEQVLFPRHMLHNTAILFHDKLQVQNLTSEPILCPIPEDLLEFSPMQELMKRANLSLKQEEQCDVLKKIFKEMNDTDFTKEFCLGEN